MANISPFNALRYNNDFASNMSCLVSQPYDVIDEAMLVHYHQKSEYNVINLIQYKTDDKYKNPYVKAKQTLDSWIRRGVLIQDSEPSIYIYQQQFQLENGQKKNRLAFIALGKLENYSSGIIFRHERTFQELKIDRLNLLRYTQTNFGQIFMLYDDLNKSINNLLTFQITKNKPIYDFELNGRDRHRLWKVSDADFIQNIEMQISHKELIIADGHHRYEAALLYRDEQPEINNAKYRMMTFVNMADDGLMIFPTHRLLKIANFKFDIVLRQLQRYFEVENSVSANCHQFIDKMKLAATEDNIFGFYAGDKKYFYLKPKQSLRNIMKNSQKSRVLRRLDVLVLNTFLNHLFQTEEFNDINIAYSNDAEKAQFKIDSGDYNCVFYLNPTRMDQIRAVSFENEVMPQKSTYFYPKILTGLVFYKLN